MIIDIIKIHDNHQVGGEHFASHLQHWWAAWGKQKYKSKYKYRRNYKYKYNTIYKEKHKYRYIHSDKTVIEKLGGTFIDDLLALAMIPWRVRSITPTPAEQLAQKADGFYEEIGRKAEQIQRHLEELGRICI